MNAITTFFQGWRKEVLIALGLGILSIILWRVPYVGWLFYPFHLFGTFIHELSHGLAAIFTGGSFVRFTVSPDLSGLAWSAGGIRWIVTSAGYIGSAIFGGVLMIISAWGAPGRAVLFWLGILLGILCLLFVRNLFGIFTGLLLAAGLIVAGKKLNEFWANGLLLFLSVQSMLNAVNSVFGLVRISAYSGDIHTDAQSMAEQTFLPAIVWAVLYSIIAIVILVFSLSVAYRRTSHHRSNVV